MTTPRSWPAFFGLLALFVAVPARAAFPLVGTVTVGGSGGGLDAANAIAQDASGNLYVAGSLDQGAGDDIWVAKYSPALVLLSSYTYDKAGFSDMAWGVGVDTTSGGVFAAGFISSGSAPSSKNIWIARFNSSLVLQSSVSVNGSASNEDEANGMRVYGGSLFVVGHSSATGGRAHWVARYDTNLVLIASSTFVQCSAYGFDILPTASGDVFVAGSRCPNSATSNDAWIGKYSSSLVLLTSATVNGSTSNTDQYQRLAEDGSGGVYAVGYLNTATAADRFIQRYDANLVRVSSALINGPGNSNEYLADIMVTSSGTLLVSGDQSDTARLGGRNALIAEYNSGRYGKGLIAGRIGYLLLRVDEQAAPVDRPLPLEGDALSVSALDPGLLPEAQAVPYLAFLITQIHADAERAFGKGKAKQGYREARKQVLGSDPVLGAADLAGLLPKL